MIPNHRAEGLEPFFGKRAKMAEKSLLREKIPGMFVIPGHDFQHWGRLKTVF